MRRGQAPRHEIDARVRRCLMLGLATALLASCSHDRSQAEDAPAPAARVIIRFVDSQRSAPGVIRMRGLHRAILLRHDREMSGDAHVYAGRLTQAQAGAIARRLDKRPDVLYAQADRKFNLWGTPPDNK